LKPRDFYEARAKSIIKELRDETGLTYKELARRLEAEGVVIDPQVLINRVNQGKFSFAFALQLLAAMGQTSVAVPKRPRAEARPRRQGTTKG
jgi:hypothetical protein